MNHIENGELREINRISGLTTQTPYHHQYNEDDKSYNEICDAMTEDLYNLLIRICKMHKIYLPPPSQLRSAAATTTKQSSSFVFCTKKKLENTKKLLILIHGSDGKVRAGQWSRKLITQESLQSGSMIPYIKKAQKEGFDIIVTNTNYNYENPEAHIQTVWENLIVPAYKNIETFAIIAHSYGGSVTLKLAKDHSKHFMDKCFGICFIDCVLDVTEISKAMLTRLKKV